MQKTIVWIEDDLNIIEPVVHPLKRAGYEIIEFESISQALNNIDLLKKADLILLDLIMPNTAEDPKFSGYSGIELLKKIRKKYLVNTPVVVFTVVQNEEIKGKLKELGVTDIVFKPVRPSKLKSIVDSILTKHIE